MKKKIAVGLSGGVDSAVTAALLKEQGHEVIGISMEIYDESLGLVTEGGHACFGPDEVEDMRMAAMISDTLNIEFYRINLKEKYKQTVLSYFHDEYLCGRTPNPCIVCNNKMKFGFLLSEAAAMGLDFDYFATGHYAIVKEGQIYKALNRSKDQTYFLYALNKKLLDKLIFPLGEITKDHVREIARKYNLPCSDQEESQDFISGDYAQLFNENEIKPGNIFDEQGSVLGRHKGIIHYTIGQRKGLGIGHSSPLYVKKINPADNTITVTDKENLFSSGLKAEQLNYLTQYKPENGDYAVKIRKNNQDIPASILFENNDKFQVDFKTPQLSVTPGQSLVIYNNNQLIGGGVIQSALGVQS